MTHPFTPGPTAPGYVESWDEYFLGIAIAVSTKSKDPRCQVGAVIVSEEKLVLSTGFNGLARGVFDSEEILADVDEKLKWICHAENNAILNAARVGVAVAGATMFVNKFPCFACCNAIAQAGIKRICTQDNRFWDDDPLDADHTRKRALLKQADIEVDAPLHPDFVPLQAFRRNIKPDDRARRAAASEATGKQLELSETRLPAPGQGETRLVKAPSRRNTRGSQRRRRAS